MATAFQTTAFSNLAFAAGRQLEAATGMLTLAGNGADGWVRMPATAGVFTVVKNPSALRAARVAFTAPGHLGISVGSTVLSLSMPGYTGTYTASINGNVLSTRVLSAPPRDVKVSYFAVGMQKGMVPHGNYVLLGGTAGAELTMPLDSGEYTIGGFENSRSIGRVPLNAGIYAYNGPDASFEIVAHIDPGAFPLAGFDVVFGVSRVGHIGPIQVVQKKNPATFLWSKILPTETFRYAVATNDVYVGRRFSASGTFTVSLVGYDAWLQDRRRLDESSGLYLFTGGPSLLIKGGLFDFSSAKTVMVVPKENWVMECA
jgi:hypothetical protein